MLTIINIEDGKKYRCYDFVACPDGMTYGVCYADDLESFIIIPYNKMKPCTTI